MRTSYMKQAGSALLNLSKSVVCLRATGQGFHGQLFVVPRQESIIGRTPECQILLNHGTVSHQHCRMELSPAGVYVKDLGSVNGTWVNGSMVIEAFLRQGDILKIGEVNLVLEIRSLADFDPQTNHVPPPTQDCVATRLMGVGGAKPEPLTYDHLRRNPRKQRTRMTNLFKSFMR